MAVTSRVAIVTTSEKYTRRVYFVGTFGESVYSTTHVLERESMRSGDVIDKLEAAGWVEVRRESSHVTFKKQGEPLLATVPHPRKEVAIGTLRKLERDSGVRLR